MAISKINTPEIFDLGATNTSLKLPSGGTDSRPSNPSTGQWRYNTDLKYVEYYDGSNWQQINIEEDCTTDTVNFPSGATLAAYYKLDYTPRDESTNNYDGTQVDVSYVNGSPYSQAAVFNGSSSYINLPLNIASLFFGKNTLAVSFWFKTTTTARQRMFTDYAQSSRNIDITMDGTTGGTVEVVTMYSSSSITFDSTASYNDGNWHQIVVALDQSSLTRTIYIDNVLLNTATFSSNSYNGTNGARVTIGAFYSSTSGYSQFFDGQIDQLRVFTSAITNTQVSELYNEVQCPCTTNTIGYSVDAIGSTTNTSTEAYYKLDGNAYDATANANNGTWYGTEAYDVAPYGVAAKFNGTNSYIGASNSVQQPTTNFSVSIWTKLDSLTGGGSSGSIGFIGNFRTGNTPQEGFAIAKVSTENSFSFWADGTANSKGGKVIGTTVIQTGIWYHVVGTYDGANVKIYVNGTLENSVSYTSTPATTDQPLVVGRWYGNFSDYYLNGQIDQTRIYSTALDSDQVSELYNEVYCNTISTLDVFGDSTGVALYELNGNADSTDSSSNNGTWIGTEAYAGGYFDSAADFNGSNGINLPSILPANSTASSTATCWFNTSYSGSNMGTIFSSWNGNSSDPGFGLWTEGSANYLRMASYYLFGNVVGTDGTTNVSDGQWHFVAVVFDYSAGTLKCFLDGNSTPEITISGTSAASVDNWTTDSSIGYQIPGNSRYFVGKMDQARIFNKALTQFEILQLYSE